MKQVAGVDLDVFIDPIRDGLQRYETMAGGELMFDIDGASILELTPKKGNSARSVTDAHYRGNLVGSLFVIAFKPEDGSGDESTFKADELIDERGGDVIIPRIPRAKKRIHSEVHLALAAQPIDAPNADPRLFGGTFDLLGLEHTTIRKIGELGQRLGAVADLEPRATYTVGFSQPGERFGDPHAVFSAIPDAVQVCGFLALGDNEYVKYPNLFVDLNPQLPRPV